MLATISKIAVGVLALTGRTSAADAQEWRTRSIYQVMIDRFALTDGSTDKECDVSRFCGGTWKGLKNKLDYIQGALTPPHCRLDCCPLPPAAARP